MSIGGREWADLISQSPNPRPTVTAPREPWTVEQLAYLAAEYNAMIGEIEKLSGALVAVGVDPRAALAMMAEPPAAKTYHPAVVDVLRYFEFAHLPEHLQAVAKRFFALAHHMAEQLEGPQLTNGLTKLLEAKDCFVRAALR